MQSRRLSPPHDRDITSNAIHIHIFPLPRNSRGKPLELLPLSIRYTVTGPNRLSGRPPLNSVPHLEIATTACNS